ncbi:TonB-dependent receptor [Olivibacter sitiensis]|uniref:TonB-dependent receptor n=1 Tax=Olivibacter sitiensis TaxID=376470 RepID=UPI0004175D1B|nr:TonB-dependent receptor [Olivibacter sitiensis]
MNLFYFKILLKKNCGLPLRGVLIAKMLFLSIVILVSQVNAKGFAQDITIRKSNIRLEEIFLEIQRQAHVRVFCDAQVLEKMEPITIDMTSKSVDEVLDYCFRNTPYTYKRDNNTIIIVQRNGTDAATTITKQMKISGRVADENGETVPGVSIRTDNGINTTSNADGLYTITSPQTVSTITFRAIGFEDLTVEVNGRTSIDVVLKTSNTALDEVVVVGYGTQKRRNVVAAVDQVQTSAFEGRPVVNTTQALQGVSPSLVVQQRSSEPGGGINLNIRGISTLGNNSPLVVIDGIVGGDINLLNPADIASVSVLKDAGSAAIYGSRANNGVVLITTKQGSKDSRSVLAYNGLLGMNDPHMFFKPVHGYENAMLRNQSAVNAGLQPVYSPSQIRQFQEDGDEEWFVDGILQQAIQQNHNLSLSGGNASSTYHVSAGYFNQQSNFVGPDYGLKRYNYRINLTNEVGRLRLATQMAYARSENKDHSSSTQTLMVDAARVPLYYRMKDDEGRYLTNDVLTEFNPLGVLEQGGFRNYTDDNLFANVSAEMKVTDFLKLRGVFGGSLKANNQFARTMRVDFYPSGVSGADQNTNDEAYKSLELNTQFMAEFNKSFARHDVAVLVGVSNENFGSRMSSIYRRYTDPELGTPITETVIGTNSSNSNQTATENSLNSLFGRASYTYDEKYYAEFNFRVDGSSKFRKNNRWGFFPSISAGYRLSDESFMDFYKERIGDAKLRGSYGVVGNQNVGNFQYQTTYFTFQNAYGFNNVGVGGTGYNFANPDLRWERAATLNIGLDLTFLNDKLTVSADYFNKVTSDILIPPQVPGVFGTSLPDFNAAKVRNQGWELAATYTQQGRLFRHMLTLNVGDSHNEVLYFEGNQRLQGVEELQILLKEGFPFNSYVGLKRDGYFQTIDDVNAGPKPPGLNVQPGDNRYVDVNGDGVIDNNDLFVFGNPFPRFNYGAQYQVSFKGLDLNLFLQGVGKRTMMIRGELVEPYHFNYGLTMYQHQLDYWTPANPNARYPQLSANNSNSNINNFRRGSDMYLYNAAYLRLKNIQLGYSLPSSVVGKIGLQKCRVYLSGQNLFTLSGVKFIDPEITEFDSNLRNDGANSGRAYPTLIYYGMGLDITF